MRHAAQCCTKCLTRAIHRRPGQMSGGQAQRVAVARAMVTEPAVLFADEPTGALDSIAAEQVMGAIAETARETGTTVVLVTHEARVAAYGDRDIEVRDGQVRGGQASSGTVVGFGASALDQRAGS
ncbi:MAG: ATP-binding cassette domain-containing protein [Pedococcus sp.]